MASRRKRGPVALRLQLWLDLPLSELLCALRKVGQLWDVLRTRIGTFVYRPCRPPTNSGLFCSVDNSASKGWIQSHKYSFNE
jgi:hypothetical protein